MNAGDPQARFESRAREWRVSIGRSCETPNSLIGFGRRDNTDVVLKVIKREGDEWWSGNVLSAFGGRGCVRALEHAGGAVLMEYLRPGNPLSGLVRQGEDDQATSVLCDVIAGLSRTEVSFP